MKCDIIIIWKNNEKTNIPNSDITLNSETKIPTIRITQTLEHDYNITLSLVRRVIIDPIHPRQTTLKPVFDDIASSLPTKH